MLSVIKSCNRISSSSRLNRKITTHTILQQENKDEGGYVYLDQEEAIEEIERPLSPYRSIPLNSQSIQRVHKIKIQKAFHVAQRSYERHLLHEYNKCLQQDKIE